MWLGSGILGKHDPPNPPNSLALIFTYFYRSFQNFEIKTNLLLTSRADFFEASLRVEQETNTSQQQETGTPEEQAEAATLLPDGIPFPIAPQMKATILVTIKLIEILSIALVAVSLSLYARYDG